MLWWNIDCISGNVRKTCNATQQATLKELSMFLRAM